MLGLGLWEQVIETNIKKLKDNAKIVSEYKVILHLYKIFLLMIWYVLVPHKFVQDLNFYKSLDSKFLFVFDYLNSMERICTEINAFDDLPESSLTYEVDDLILGILRRNYYLVFPQDRFSTWS